MSSGLDPRGPAAAEIAGLWWFMFWLGLAVFAVFLVALAVALARARRERGVLGVGPAMPGQEPEETGRLIRVLVVGLGVVMSAAVLLVVLVATVLSMRALPDRAHAGALALDLEARQFEWEVTYPGGTTTVGEVRIPAGEAVVLRLRSADVIHSFWVPALAGKLDALPERTNSMIIEAHEPGIYRGQCAEFCGLHHAGMEVRVIAMPPEEFTRWLEGQA